MWLVCDMLWGKKDLKVQEVSLKGFSIEDCSVLLLLHVKAWLRILSVSQYQDARQTFCP